MSHPWIHAVSSARHFGGAPEDYLKIHAWLDATKEHFCDFRHRALRHHAEGIFECERVFGPTLTNSAGDTIPVRPIAEQHIREDCGGIVPTLADWLRAIRPEPWMNRVESDPSPSELLKTGHPPTRRARSEHAGD